MAPETNALSIWPQGQVSQTDNCRNDRNEPLIEPCHHPAGIEHNKVVPVDQSKRYPKVRSRGIEPRPPAWKAGILATELRTHGLRAFDGSRTRDLSLTKRVLYQLSYNGNSVALFLKKYLLVLNLEI